MNNAQDRYTRLTGDLTKGWTRIIKVTMKTWTLLPATTTTTNAPLAKQGLNPYI